MLSVRKCVCVFLLIFQVHISADIYWLVTIKFRISQWIVISAVASHKHVLYYAVYCRVLLLDHDLLCCWIMIYYVVGSWFIMLLDHDLLYCWIMIYYVVGSWFIILLDHDLLYCWIMIYYIVGLCCWILIYYIVGSWFIILLDHDLLYCWIMIYYVVGSWFIMLLDHDFLCGKDLCKMVQLVCIC